MGIKAGILDESYKYSYGLFSTSPKVEGQKDKGIFDKDTIKLNVAKRDRAAFQLVIQAEEDATVSVGNRPVFSPKGDLLNLRISVSFESLKKSIISIYPIGLVEDDDKTMKADILLQDEVVTFQRQRPQFIWIEATIPEETDAKLYVGKVNIYAQRMFENEYLIRTLEFEINVKDVLLPEPRDYKFHLDLWQHLSNIARKHEVKLWSERHFEVIEHYVKSLAELGQKAITVIASEIPWSGQGCFRVENYPSDMFEFNIVSIEKGDKFIFDFSIMERYIKLCFKYGIDREIELIGLICIWKYETEGYGTVSEDYPDAIRIRYFDKSDGCYKYMRTKSEILEYIKALEKYFIDMGWMEKVRILADEPHDKKLYNEVLTILKEVAPSFSYKAAINHIEFFEESKNRIDDFISYLPTVSEGWNCINALRGSIKGRLLWYVCCEPLYPNTFISSPLVESRLIGNLTAFINFDGFLRWNYTVWPEKPREKIAYNYPLWNAGDTNFVYPSNNGSPLLTLRYKALKRGIEDFELIALLKVKHPNSEEILKKVWNCIFKVTDITKFYNLDMNPKSLYSSLYNDYEKAKCILLDAIAE